MPLTANEVFRDYVVDGVPSSGVHQPVKADIRSLLTNLNSVNFYNVKRDFGAAGDQITDDTAAIQLALNTVPAHGTLYFPEGFYKIIGAGSAALTRSTPINLVGDGQKASSLFFDASVPNTRDMLVITAASSDFGFHIHDMGFLAGGLGRDMVVIDGGGVSFFFYQVHMHDVFISESDAGVSLKLNGVAYSTIERNNLESILIENGGDGLIIRENIIGSPTSGNHCIEASFVAGAGGFVVTTNVLAGIAAHVLLHDAVGAVISFNELETPVGVPNTHGVLLDIGDTGQVLQTLLLGNGISILAGTSDPMPIYVRGNCIGVQLKESRIIIGTGSHITDDGLETSIDRNMSAFVGANMSPLLVVGSGTRRSFNETVANISLTANQTGTDTASAQVWFPGGGPTGISLRDSSTYEFEGLLMFSRTAGTNSHTVGMNFSGTAGISNIAYEYDAAGADSTVFNGTQNTVSGYVETASNQTVFGIPSTSANQVISIKVRGIVRTTGTPGTFIPNFQYSAAPGGAPTIRRNSYFRVWESK